MERKTKSKHIQTDKMSNIGRRKCKYFGAAWFSFLIWSQELCNFSAPSFSFLSASAQMPSLCALCSRLSFWNLLFSHQTTYWEQTDRQRERGGKRKEEAITMRCEDAFMHIAVAGQENGISWHALALHTSGNSTFMHTHTHTHNV